MPADSHLAQNVNAIEHRDECANDDNHGVQSGNADEDLSKITDNVPDSQNNHEHSLGENDTNVLTSNDTTEIESQTTNSAESFGGNEFIRKQWHRRLRTPVWARCSIKQTIFFLSFYFPIRLFCLFFV